MIPKIIFNREKKDWVKRPLLSNIEKIIDYRGRTPKKLGLSWSDTGYLALSALNVKNGYIDFKATANYGDQELYERWMGDNHLHKGQVVFTTEAPMGNVAQIPNDDLYILSQRTIAFEVKRDLIREDFLATLLRSQKIFNKLTSLSSGGTAKGVSQKSLSNLKVCLPTSLEEQSAIGSLFRTLDDLLFSYKDNLANYQSLKATMLSKMFPKAGQTVPEIRIDGFEGEWVEKRLKDISKRVTRKNNDLVSERALTISAQFGLIDQEEFFQKKIASKDVSGYYLIKKGEFAYNKSYSTGYPLGAIKRLDKYENGVLSTLYILFKAVDVDSDYLTHYYESDNWHREVSMCAAEGARNHGLLNIAPADFFNTRLVIPKELAEQQAIGGYFSNLDNLINSHQEKITQLETLKKKLLQDMFI
ncbi:restriction endonuclease subunit S [Streptococcus cristatus]|uniref:Type I restriction-modification system, specificity subunit S n=1 Tax=Streptococcus cristatus TaxID=45634 RepID=A0A139MY51_STRCR|nr:restriction endonuclease subunit S [Streptococcus cristatus]KXT68602.1 Type I restriction-modification system, specificity subunit S [Streptococcus cristatus]